MKLCSVQHNYQKGIKTYRFLGIKIWSKIDKSVIKHINSQIKLLRQLVNSSVDITKLRSATGKLRQNQMASVQILKTVDKVCRQYSYKYWLDFGTLLGAVRHGGFIPWDDDIDICMLREDFNNILPKLKEIYFNNPELTVRERYDNHFQIRVKNSDNKIGLDIFPVDIYERDGLSDDELNKFNAILHKITIKLTKENASKRLNMSQIRDTIQNLYAQNLPSKFGHQGKLLFYGIDYPHSHENKVMKYDTIFPLKTLSFEGVEFPVPNNSNKHLNELYGDYMQLPTQDSYS